MYFGLHTKEIELQIAPVDLYSVLSEQSETTFLLESAEGTAKKARFSFLGFSPSKKIVFENKRIRVDEEEFDTRNPLEFLKQEISVSNAPTTVCPFIGGAVGYVSFEYIHYLEKLQTSLQITDELSFPDFEFGIFDDCIVYDHKENTVRYMYTKENRLDEMYSFIKDATFDNEQFEMYNKKCTVSKDQFCKNVARAKEYILQGDVFQTVLSKRYDLKFKGSLLPFYKKLKAINPSPYMYYLKFKDRQVIGSSPENLVRVEGNIIKSYATLAGTRPRGKTPEEDKQLEIELLTDEKEKAEHLMLVDLTRNDIGKVAKPGTVSVPELMKIQKYSHVQHISSLVEGILQEGRDAYDAFNAIFPAGTVSGAPKVRALEIIRELEKTKRGPYGGAVGYFSRNGNCDFAIGIRTLFANKNKAYIQTGAGIVYDSIAEKEFEETENKAQALLHAVGDEKYEALIT